MDWEVGKHGIMIDFEVDDREFHATFLPEVASEEGWDQKTTLRYLVRKAGCYMFDDELLNSIQCTRYQTEKAYLLFQDYVKMTQSGLFVGIIDVLGMTEQREESYPIVGECANMNLWLRRDILL